MKAVKVHCGNAHVRGSARKYAYFIASLFVQHTTVDGRVIWRNSGKSTTPRRSMRLANEDGERLAKENNAVMVSGYGSLHNRKAWITSDHLA